MKNSEKVIENPRPARLGPADWHNGRAWAENARPKPCLARSKMGWLWVYLSPTRPMNTPVHSKDTTWEGLGPHWINLSPTQVGHRLTQARNQHEWNLNMFAWPILDPRFSRLWDGVLGTKKIAIRINQVYSDEVGNSILLVWFAF